MTGELGQFLSNEELKNYMEHMAHNSEIEQVKINDMRESNKTYRQDLIKMILDDTDNFTKEELQARSIRRLESMYDYKDYHNPNNKTKPTSKSRATQRAKTSSTKQQTTQPKIYTREKE